MSAPPTFPISQTTVEKPEIHRRKSRNPAAFQPRKPGQIPGFLLDKLASVRQCQDWQPTCQPRKHLERSGDLPSRARTGPGGIQFRQVLDPVPFLPKPDSVLLYIDLFTLYFILPPWLKPSYLSLHERCVFGQV